MTDTPAAPGSAEYGEPVEGTAAADRAEISAPADRHVHRPGETNEADAAAAAQMLSVDARKVVLVGTSLFLLAFLVMLPMYSWLGHHGHRVWLWTALAGCLLGASGLGLIGKHTGEGRLG